MALHKRFCPSTIRIRCRELMKLDYTALEAWRTAKTVVEFTNRECGEHDEPGEGSDVRLRVEEEQESYFDVYGEPDGYEGMHGRRVSAEQERKEMVETLDRDGCWRVFSEFWNPETEEWEVADSVGMNTGYSDPTSWRENCYVPDLMQAALDQADLVKAERSDLAVMTTG